MSNKMKTIAMAVALAAVLTGCTPIKNNGANIAAMQELSKSPMPGFEYTGGSDGDSVCYFATYCNGSASATFTSSKSFDSRSQFCKQLIDWAPSIGADSWRFDPEYIALPLKGHEGAATYSCIGANQFSLVGTTNDIRWVLQSDSSMIEIATAEEDFEDMGDDRLNFRSWGDALALLQPGSKLNMEVLSAIETYRLANPAANPNSQKTLEKALKDVKLPEGSKLVKDKSGKVHYLYMPADGILLERCINVTPFDPEYFQMENPGSGFFVLPILDGQAAIDEFGYTDFKACPGS